MHKISVKLIQPIIERFINLSKDVYRLELMVVFHFFICSYKLRAVNNSKEHPKLIEKSLVHISSIQVILHVLGKSLDKFVIIGLFLVHFPSVVKV